jgi:hypothetical protein
MNRLSSVHGGAMQMQSQFQPNEFQRDRLTPKRAEAQDQPATESNAEIGARHGFGPEATIALWDALVLGQGGMAQFSHPEFGGSGQWMRGGMLMIGDMFNRQLAARVGALCDDLAQWLADHPPRASSSSLNTASDGSEWWPPGLHSPSSSGAQNGVRYAYFAQQRRLAIERAGKVDLYNTEDHLIGSVAQQQGGLDSLTFTSQRGAVELAALRRVREESGN